VNSKVWVYLYNAAGAQKSQGASVDLSSGTGTFIVDTTKIDNGDSWLDVGQVGDGHGNFTNGDTYFKDYIVDNTPPVVTVTPVAGSELSGTVTFTINVTDNNPLDPTKNTKVWVYLYNAAGAQKSQGASVDLSNGAGTFTVDTTKIDNGDSWLDVGQVFDAAGNPSGPVDNYFESYDVENIPPDTTPPSVPTLLSPVNGDITPTNSFTFTWNSSTDDQPGPITYEFHSSMNPAETGGVLTTGLWDSGTLTSPSIVSSGAPDGAWYWQVRAKDAAGNTSAWSDIWAVTLNTVPPPALATCPVGTSPVFVETDTVNSNSYAPTVGSNDLTNGQTYLLVASGAWQNGNLNLADTAYASVDNWTTYMQGYHIAPYSLGPNEFQLQVNGAFVNWGAYQPTHQYSYLYTGVGSPVSLMVFDGDSTVSPAQANDSWYGDNSGSLAVNVYSCNSDDPPVDPDPVTYVSTDGATGVTSVDATLNGTNGASDATGHSFWVSTSTFSTASPNIPSGVYSSPDFGAISASTAFSASLSSITTTGIPANLPAVTPNTTYYFAAWSLVDGTWHPGEILTFNTSAAVSTGDEITAFGFASPAATGVIDQDAHTIAVTVPYGTDVTNLTPTITLSDGATVSPTDSQDFTNPVTYTVTAQDGITTQSYVVTVTIGSAFTVNTVGAPEGTGVSVTINNGDPSPYAGTIALNDGDTFSAAGAPVEGYTITPSGDCSGTAVGSQQYICTLTYAQTGTLNISVAVVGGSAAPSDFTLSVIAGDPSVSTFPGDESGTAVTIDANVTYHVNISSLANYTYAEVAGSDCNDEGGLLPGNSANCAITETYLAPAFVPLVNNISGNINSGGGGSAYEVSINGGATKTTSADVTLSLYGTTAVTMAISNTSDFTNATWVPYATTLPWTLSSGAGAKTIYAEFRDLGGTEIGSAQATIDLASGQVLGASTFNFTGSLSLGSRGSAVTELQKLLTQLGLYTGPINGYFGPLTQAAVKAFQQKYGLPVTGVVGPLTIAELNVLENGQVLGASTSVAQLQLLALLQQLLALLQSQSGQ
jgi:hypothetical protein